MGRRHLDALGVVEALDGEEELALPGAHVLVADAGGAVLHAGAAADVEKVLVLDADREDAEGGRVALVRHDVLVDVLLEAQAGLREALAHHVQEALAVELRLEADLGGVEMRCWWSEAGKAAVTLVKRIRPRTTASATMVKRVKKSAGGWKGMCKKKPISRLTSMVCMIMPVSMRW